MRRARRRRRAARRVGTQAASRSGGAPAHADSPRPDRPRRGVRAAADRPSRACRRRASRSSGRACSARSSAPPSPLATLRRSRLSPGTRELAAAGVAFLPAALALRGPELAAYHGAEHISIGTYENGGTPAPKEHPRCGSQLIAPMVASSLAVNVVAVEGACRDARPHAARRDRRRDRRLGRDLLVGRPQPRRIRSRACSRARVRAPAPPLDGRAVRRISSRSRTPLATPASRSSAPPR